MFNEIRFRLVRAAERTAPNEVVQDLIEIVVL